MLEHRRLDACLYDAIVKHTPAGKLPEDEEMLVAAGFAAFNHIYGEIRGRSGGTGYLLGDGKFSCFTHRTPSVFHSWLNSQSPLLIQTFR